MEYYRLMQDRRYEGKVMIAQNSSIKNYLEASMGAVDQLEPISVATVHSHSDNFYPDVIDTSLFMVRDSIMEVFRFYLPSLQSKRICLIDRTRGSNEVYYVPLLPQKDCIAQGHSISPRRDEQNVVLDACAAGHAYLFRVKCREHCIIAISQAVCESILRRNPFGIQLKKITCI